MKQAVLTLLAVGGLALAGGVPAYAASSATSAPPQSAGSAEVAVVPADRIVGRAVVDPQGTDAGRVVTLLIDSKTGDVEYVLIGGHGNFNLNGQLAAVPWSALREPLGNGPLTVKMSADKLSKGPQVSAGALAVLDRPEFARRVYGYYSYPYRAGFPNAYYGGGYAPPIVINNANGTSSSNPAVVDKNPIASAVRSPNSASPRALRSITVHAGNGKAVGTIDQIMIDPAHGAVAFVLVRAGGFLGLNPSWFAMPIEALRWSPVKATYELTVDQARLKQVPIVPANAGNLPHQVSRSALTNLYADFNLKPYWEIGSNRQQASAG